MSRMIVVVAASPGSRAVARGVSDGVARISVASSGNRRIDMRSPYRRPGLCEALVNSAPPMPRATGVGQSGQVTDGDGDHARYPRPPANTTPCGRARVPKSHMNRKSPFTPIDGMTTSISGPSP